MDTTDKLLLDPENKESFISGKYVIEFDNFRLNRSMTQEFESAVLINKDIFGANKNSLTMNQLDIQTISDGYANFKANRMEKLVDQLELNITF